MTVREGPRRSNGAALPCARERPTELLEEAEHDPKELVERGQRRALVAEFGFRFREAARGHRRARVITKCLGRPPHGAPMDRRGALEVAGGGFGAVDRQVRERRAQGRAVRVDDWLENRPFLIVAAAQVPGLGRHREPWHRRTLITFDYAIGIW
ncbi:MAG: hypothetical protein NXI31_02810 [bacterium]|nr:hypothetical protein [bacterium]